MTLKAYTIDQLLEELVRRRNVAEARKEPPEQWCEACTHFKTERLAVDRYNPCQKRHKMKFFMPPQGGDPHSTDFGYYRNCCPDRAPVAEAPQ